MRPRTANSNTKEEHAVELATNAADAYLISQASLAAPKPNEIGKFIFAIDTRNTKLYGPVEAYAYVVVDGKKEISETYKLIIKAEIVEDFSALTPEDKQQAPIIEIPNEIDLGKVAAGKTLKYVFPIKNTGVNPLDVHRVYCEDSNLRIKAPKPIKSGKKGAVTVEINAKEMEPGAYSRHLQIISNDYEHSKKQVTVYWIVE